MTQKNKNKQGLPWRSRDRLQALSAKGLGLIPVRELDPIPQAATKNSQAARNILRPVRFCTYSEDLSATTQSRRRQMSK